MRTVVDTAPRCRRPAHADRGTNCGRVDQGTLTIGTCMQMIQPAIVESAQAGAGAALYRARAGS
jgi:hypothetical protein